MVAPSFINVCFLFVMCLIVCLFWNELYEELDYTELLGQSRANGHGVPLLRVILYESWTHWLCQCMCGLAAAF